jgi:lipoyl(octanoyl) transferase
MEAGGRLAAMEAVITRRAARVVWLGRIGYEEAWTLQREAADAVRAGGPETLFLLEHEPVFTLGRNAVRSDVLFSEEECRRRRIAVVESDRGGQVTYHGPGQLVGYPIVNLHPDRRDVKRYVTDLEEALVRTLARFGIRAAPSPLRERVSSLWVGDDKIAALGIHIARWVTTHGFALNVTNEPLENFRGIVPCGITDGGVTTMERVLGRGPSVSEVARELPVHFGDVFGREIIGT